MGHTFNLNIREILWDLKLWKSGWSESKALFRLWTECWRLVVQISVEVYARYAWDSWDFYQRSPKMSCSRIISCELWAVQNKQNALRKKALKIPAKGYLLGELGDTMMRPLFGNVWYVGGGLRNEPELEPEPKPKHRLGVRNWVSLSDSLRSGGDSSKPSGSSASSTCSDGTLRLSSGLFSFSFSMVASIFFCTVEDIFCKQDFSQVAIIFA